MAGEPAPETVTTPPVEAARTDDADDEDLPPPALIVRLPEPDRAASSTIGAPNREHLGPGVTVTFGLSPSGRGEERATLRRAVQEQQRDNVLSVPHPRLSRSPTRVATKTSFDTEPPKKA